MVLEDPVEDPGDTADSFDDVHSLRIVSWNIGCLQDEHREVFCNTNTYTGEDFVRTEEHRSALRTHAERFKADIVFVQEVENVDAVNQIFPGWSVQTMGGTYQRVGVAVAPDSDATVTDVQVFEPLRVSNWLRPGLEAIVTYRGHTVWVLAVHLKAGCQTGNLGSAYSSCETLETQLQYLVSWIETREILGQSYAILGDFNRQMEGDEVFEASLEAVASGNLYRTTRNQRSTCWHHHPDAPHHDWYIDHHILSDTVVDAWGEPGFEVYLFNETYEDAWRYVSDHCPIIVSFP